MKKKNLPVTNVGAVSLMMIFIILCMITLAALSLSSSSRNAHLSRKMTDHLAEYYTASNEAEALLAHADDIFAEAFCKTNSTEEYYGLIRKELPSGSVETIQNGDSLTIGFQVKINDAQSLSVLVDVFSLQQIKEMDTDSYYKILSWQTVSSKPWESNNKIQLIQ